MPIQKTVSCSVTCDECGQYCGHAGSIGELRASMKQKGWFREGHKELCGRHRDFPAGTKVRILAGVNPRGQSRTWQGSISLANGSGNDIWQCGHKHRQTSGDNAEPKAAFKCARDYAGEKNWVVA